MVLVVAALSSERMGHAQSVEPARMGLAVHPEGGMWLNFGPKEQPGGTPVMGSIGVGAGFDIARHFEAGVELAKVLSQSRAFVDGPGGDPVIADVNAGWLVGGLLHYRYPERGLAFVVGAGSALIAGGDFGTVPLLQIELGIEYRAPSGFYLLWVTQMMTPLVTREWPPSRCYYACPLRLDPGQPMFGPHVAVGLLF